MRKNILTSSVRCLFTFAFISDVIRYKTLWMTKHCYGYFSTCLKSQQHRKVLFCTWPLVVYDVYFWTICFIDVVYHRWYTEFFSYMFVILDILVQLWQKLQCNVDITKFYSRRKYKKVLVNDSSECESESQHTVKTVRKNWLCAWNASTTNMKINFCTHSFSIVV